PGKYRREVLKDDLLAAAVGQMLRDVEDRLDELGQVGALALAFAATAGLQQPLGDVLAAKGLLLDHAEILGEYLDIISPLGGGPKLLLHLGQASFQGFGAEGNGRQRIVDLVSHASGKEADTGEALGADQLAAAFVDLLGHVAVEVAQAAGHVVEG